MAASGISYNLIAYQGSDISFRVTLVDENRSPIDLDGSLVRGQVRASYGSTGVLLDLNPTIYNPPESGIISINISGSQASSLPIGQFVYDIEKYPSGSSGETLKVLRGYFSILPEVTR